METYLSVCDAMYSGMFTDVLEKCTVSIFRVAEYAYKGRRKLWLLGLPFNIIDRGCRFLQNISKLLPDYSVMYCKLVFFIFITENMNFHFPLK